MIITSFLLLGLGVYSTSPTPPKYDLPSALAEQVALYREIDLAAEDAANALPTATGGIEHEECVKAVRAKLQRVLTYPSTIMSTLVDSSVHLSGVEPAKMLTSIEKAQARSLECSLAFASARNAWEGMDHTNLAFHGRVISTMLRAFADRWRGLFDRANKLSSVISTLVSASVANRESSAVTPVDADLTEARVAALGQAIALRARCFLELTALIDSLGSVGGAPWSVREGLTAVKDSLRSQIIAPTVSGASVTPSVVLERLQRWAKRINEFMFLYARVTSRLSVPQPLLSVDDIDTILSHIESKSNEWKGLLILMNSLMTVAERETVLEPLVVSTSTPVPASVPMDGTSDRETTEAVRIAFLHQFTALADRFFPLHTSAKSAALPEGIIVRMNYIAHMIRTDQVRADRATVDDMEQIGHSVCGELNGLQEEISVINKGALTSVPIVKELLQFLTDKIVEWDSLMESVDALVVNDDEEEVDEDIEGTYARARHSAASAKPAQEVCGPIELIRHFQNIASVTRRNFEPVHKRLAAAKISSLMLKLYIRQLGLWMNANAEALQLGFSDESSLAGLAITATAGAFAKGAGTLLELVRKMKEALALLSHEAPITGPLASLVRFVESVDIEIGLSAIQFQHAGFDVTPSEALTEPFLRVITPKPATPGIAGKLARKSPAACRFSPESVSSTDLSDERKSPKARSALKKSANTTTVNVIETSPMEPTRTSTTVPVTRSTTRSTSTAAKYTKRTMTARPTTSTTVKQTTTTTKISTTAATTTSVKSTKGTTAKPTAVAATTAKTTKTTTTRRTSTATTTTTPTTTSSKSTSTSMTTTSTMTESTATRVPTVTTTTTTSYRPATKTVITTKPTAPTTATSATLMAKVVDESTVMAGESPNRQQMHYDASPPTGGYQQQPEGRPESSRPAFRAQGMPMSLSDVWGREHKVSPSHTALVKRLLGIGTTAPPMSADRALEDMVAEYGSPGKLTKKLLEAVYGDVAGSSGDSDTSDRVLALHQTLDDVISGSGADPSRLLSVMQRVGSVDTSSSTSTTTTTMTPSTRASEIPPPALVGLPDMSWADIVEEEDARKAREESEKIPESTTLKPMMWARSKLVNRK